MKETVGEPPDRLEDLFGRALALGAEERHAFLTEACGDDAALRGEIEALLAAHGDAEVFFDALSGDIAGAARAEIETAARPRLRIGPYRALRVLGHGGMGTVYLGVRADGEFEQRVALKLLHLDMETPESRSRFLAERQLLARLSHPNIARLLDGGVTDEGRPYFAMEHVEGEPIVEHCRVAGLTPGATLRLFLDVVEAVSYLHRNLIVHRDLKPSNVLVDTAGQVKLLDFGIAKLLAGDAEAGGLTRTGERLLTLHYAAPEQLAGEPVTTATDVYSLGVVLYELLTGSRPHDRSPLEPAAIGRGEPPPPSAVRSGLPRDLDTICLKALRPEPHRRYASAEQLGQDIERYLAGLPIRARPSTVGYRLSRFVRRNRGAVAAAAALLALLTFGLAAERRLRSQAEAARRVAQDEAAKAVAVSGFLERLLSSVDPANARGREVTVSDVLAEASARLEEGGAFHAQPAVESALRLTIGETYVALERYAEAEPHLERALELRGGADSDAPDALEALAALAALRFRSGDRAAAEPLLEAVLERRTATLGEEHPQTLEAASELANLYWYQRRWDDVESLDRRLVAVKRRTLGPRHPDTLRSINGLATTLYSRGRYAEAADLFAEALAAQEGQLGDDHPDTLRLVNNLGAALSALGRYEEAEVMNRRALEGRRSVLGEDSSGTGTALHNLGLTLFNLGRLDEAERYLQEAIEQRSDDRSLSGYWYSVSWLADLRRAQGRLAEAAELYRRSIAGLREADGPEERTTLRATVGLASIELETGDVDAAEALLLDALQVQRRILGAEHEETLAARALFARILRARGRAPEASAMAREILDDALEAHGEEHPVTARARALVAELGGSGSGDG